MSHLGITPVLILSLNPDNVLEPCLMPTPKPFCPHMLSLPISSSATSWDNARVQGECVALGVALSKWVPGAIRCGDGCCQQELVSPWLSLRCHPGKSVHCLPFYILIQCNDSVFKCYSSQVPCQLSQGCSGLAPLKCHWCCARQRNSAFPCPSSTCHPEALIQKSTALPTVPKGQLVPPNFSLMAQT